MEQYRKRFYGLMESTMGDAKPLLNEQGNPEPKDVTTPPKKVIEVINQSVIPQGLVDSPETPVGYFDDGSGKLICKKQSYKLKQ